MNQFNKNIFLFLLLLNITIIKPSQDSNTTNERPMVIVTCMYNNAQWALTNLNSIANQDYHNKRVIIVDDGSDDETPSIIENFIQEQPTKNYTFIRNATRKRKLANLYHVLYLCNDDEIVVMLDGDDWLAHHKVLTILNQAYDNPSVWMTYGQYYNVPPEEAIKWGYSPKGYASEIPKEQKEKHDYRKGPFRFMHLRSFYGWLFKTVKLEDLLSETVSGYRGCPFPASNDLAMYYPMVEGAHEHVLFIPTILYIRNLFSEIVGFKVDRKIQMASAREIRKKKTYPILESPVYRHLENYLTTPIASIIITDQDNSNLSAIITSLQNKSDQIHETYLLYRDGSLNPSSVDFTNITNTSPYQSLTGQGIGIKLHEMLSTTTSEYVILLNNDSTNCTSFDYTKATYWMTRTYAKKAYFLNELFTSQPWLFELDDDTIAWKLGSGRQAQKQLHPCNTVLYKRSDIIELLERYEIKTYHQLVLLLKKYHTTESEIVLGIKITI